MKNVLDRDCENQLWGPGWQSVREQWSLDDSTLHLNHGAYGAVPKRVRSHQQELIAHIDANPSGFFRREIETRLEEARLVLAHFCGASADGFALIRNATEGMTIALATVPLASGDEMVITNHIYPAVRLAVENKCAQTGAKLVEVSAPITDSDEAIVEAIASAITKRTRLIVVDEIASSTARMFPVREIAAVARDANVPLIVDGAHAPGMYKLSVDSLGADIWVGNFHKWVCAPHGSAGLWAAPSWRSCLRPSTVSFRDRMEFPQLFSRLGTDDLTAFLTVPIAIDFLMELGHDKMFSYNRELARRGAETIGRILGTPRVEGRFAARHPAALPAGIAVDADKALELQTRAAVELRAEVSIAPPHASEKLAAVVVSAYAYNHPNDYEEFAERLKSIL